MRTFFLLFFGVRAFAFTLFPIDYDLGGPKSAYTDLMLRYAKEFPALPSGPKDSVAIDCIETPEKKFFIGAIQTMTIEAPLSRVESVLDDVEGFADVFAGFASIKIHERDSNRYSVDWEKKIPIFFIPNIRYRTAFIVQKKPKQLIYRYKLLEATKHMRTADGIIVATTDNDAETEYVEYDFWDSDYGIVETLAPHRIWKDSIDGIFWADMAIRARSEHADWRPDQVKEYVKKNLEKFDVEACLQKKRLLDGTGDRK